jgi:uncharacterized membrane protein HdeD (DUF308 family)
MSDQSTSPHKSRRKRGLVRIAIEVVLALSGIACMVVMCAGGPVVRWYVGLILIAVGTALDPNGPC